MGMTLTEKIFMRHVGRSVKPGEIVLANIDATFSHDAVRPLAHEIFQHMGGDRVFDPQRVLHFIGHQYPAPGEAYALVHQKIREFCKEQGSVFYEGEGSCHMVMLEKGHVTPGDLVVGADSHTCTYGALGAFSTGIGASDLGAVLMGGKLWFMVPETVRMKISGKLSPGVFAKDVILYIIGKMTADGANYQAVEFTGPVIEKLSMAGRFTICNMAVEMGAKAGLIAPDETTLEWVRKRTIKEFTPETPDPDAHYAQVLEFDVSHLSPYVAKPHNVDNGVPVEEVMGTTIHQANLTSCTTGDIENLRIAASILKGRKIALGIRLFVVPGSREILKAALKEGLIDTFIDAGGCVGPPGCGGCAGTSFGVPSDGEIVISTANRNFKGRIGNPRASIYLASPATVAASALEGRIADPRHYLKNEEVDPAQGGKR